MEMNAPRPQGTELTRLDHIILQHGGKTVNTERLPIYLQSSKYDRPPTLEELQYEIGRLRQELALHQEAQRALMALFDDTKEVYRLLQDALRQASSAYRNGEVAFLELANNARDAGFLIRQSLQNVSQKLSESESRLLQAFGITLDDTSGKDFAVL